MNSQDQMSKHLACNDTHDRQQSIAMAIGIIFVIFTLSVISGAKPFAVLQVMAAGLGIIWAVHAVLQIISSIRKGAHS